MADLNLDQLMIDRVVDGWFEDKDLKLLAVLSQLSNLSINMTAESKDKTDAQGVLIKRFFTAKNVEVTGENAVFSLNLFAIQAGTEKKTGNDVTLPRILQIKKTDSPYALPDTPNEGTMIVYGTFDNGLVNTDVQYTKDDTAGPGTYAVAESGGVTTITLPTDATDTVQIKYEYTVKSGDIAARVDVLSNTFPKECKATFRVLASDICDGETVRALYIVFPRFQMSPEFDWTVDTESTQGFTAQAFKDYCGKNQQMFYVAIAEDSDEYDGNVQ